jgi:DNA-binding response OmpR family regulator
VRFATLALEQGLRDGISDALAAVGIEFCHFGSVDTLIAQFASEAFDAILVEDDASRIGAWLNALQVHVAEPFALIAVGSAGAAGMSRALLQGADDYIVIDHGMEHLVQRTIARASSKIRRPGRRILRFGPYTLDTSHAILSSLLAGTRLSPREASLARILFENHGRVVSLDSLSSEICGRTDDASRRAIKQHVHTLRKKCYEVAGSSTDGLAIESVYGNGYRLTH